MITQNNKSEFIEKYLMGGCSLWELADIEDKIRTDHAFAEEVAFQRDLLIGIREARRLDLKEKFKGAEKKPKILRLLQVDTSKLLPYAVAACITIAVMGSLLYSTISDTFGPNSKIPRHAYHAESSNPTPR